MSALKNLVGQRFGKLVVIERAENDKHGNVRWLCRCDCGNETVVISGHLKSGATQSCGCLAKERASERRLQDLTGQRFGKLTVLSYDHINRGGFACWCCLCDCGNETIVPSGALKSGNTRSCGCLHAEASPKNLPPPKHGMHGSKIYRTWTNIKTRCYNPNDKDYKDYGGRGITMYAPWIHDFAAFFNYVVTLEHYGEKGYTLDRIENDKGYQPGNLRWADAKTQERNRRINIVVEYNGEQITLGEAAERSGINYYTLYDRYNRGDRGEKLFRPVGSK